MSITRPSAPIPAQALGAATPTPPLANPPPRPAGPRCIASERLFDGAQELQIEHRGMCYRLKLTALGKLILTK